MSARFMGNLAPKEKAVATAKAKRRAQVKPKSKAKAKSKPAAKARRKAAAKAAPRKTLQSKSLTNQAWRITCKSLAEIRGNIDRLDKKIVPLLCERLHFVTQAANFKPSVAGVVVPSRVEEIVGKVRAQAASLGTSPNTIEAVYRSLIDAFTADEQKHWQELHK